METSQQLRKFGCIFENKTFYVSTDSVYNPVYGEDVEPMDFANVTEFSNVLDKIDTEYSKFLMDQVSTNILEFYDFYDAFKVHKEKNLTTDFFRDFVPKFIPHHICSSKAIDMLERLMKDYPNMNENVHLITSDACAQKRLLETLDMVESCPNHESEECGMTKCFPWISKSIPRIQLKTDLVTILNQEPPKHLFRHDHVAALLRIRIGGKRLGYVLMDPGYSLDKPIVIMEDGRAPQRSSCHNYVSIATGEEIDFTLPRWDYFFANTSSIRDKTLHPEYLLYYIGKPYCSFLMTTIKKHIIKETRKHMVRHENTGLPKASLTFDVTGKHPVFNVALRGESGTQRFKIAFGKRHKLKEKIKLLYDEVVHKINYNDLEIILDKAEDIAKDKNFLMYIKNLDKLL